MSEYVIVTYATHSEGLFETLIHNDFNVPVHVLGWGERWMSFRQKFNAVLSFVRTLPKETVVIFLDGWDTIIHRDPQCAVEIFKNSDADILFSSDRSHLTLLDNFVELVFFNSCSSRNKKLINSGMYMGYAKTIDQMLTHVLYMDPKESDDQVMINRECERLDTMMKLQVDVDGVVFKNVLYGIFNKTHKNEPYFISYPGSGGSTSFDSSQLYKRLTRTLHMTPKVMKQVINTLKIRYTNYLILFLIMIIILLLWSRKVHCVRN